MSTIQTVSDRIEIADLLARYCRAVDRCDLVLFGSVWAEGATVDYGGGSEDAAAWCEGLLGRLRAMDRTQHSISNSLVSLDGDSATGETMCTAYHRFIDDEGPKQMIVGGRYLDRLVRTGQGWRIAHRSYVMDWNETAASTAEIGTGKFARFANTGARAPEDPSYR